MIQAKWIDQALFEPAFINGNWLVHVCFSIVSIYKILSGSADLCLQTSGSRAQRDDFSCRRLCSVGDRLSWYHSLVQQRVVHFPHHRLSFSKGSQIYNDRSGWHSPI